MKGRNTRRAIYAVAGLVVVAIVAGIAVPRLLKPKAEHAGGPPSVPVVAAAAGQSDVPIYYDALGTVMAFNMVSIRAQVTGQIVSIDFRQGQDVHKGDLLAKIDPAPFQATLDQAVAKKTQDQAQLIDDEKDLERFKALVVRDAETQQNVDAQQAKVDQYKAMIAADQGAIEAAQTQLDFTTIVAPIDGVVGFRQIDIGNIIHTTDANPLTVLTQIKPCYAVFTLPQTDLGPVREAMLRGSVEVLAFDQDDVKQLAKGELLLIDNQIDQSTSTIRLKAQFPNQDERLWPGEFVHIRILITTHKNAVTVPTVALQRGPDGLYVWVIKPDNTVEQRPVQAQIVSENTAVVSKGLNPGERIVTDGQSRLDVGSHVAIRPAAASQQETDKS
ncbi:MAG TPA: efflux RND transporter periplasmic adaptor subunit [Xanthobacteraceae bacterium]|nr:efflux RND transporter periplasmic adaptor subunit [Xanthobacteraceae bacterium]